MRTKIISPLTQTPAELISTVLEYHLSLGHSFSLWRLPDSASINLIASEEGPIPMDDLFIEESAPGFVIAPFNPHSKKYFLKATHHYTFAATEISRNGEPFSSDELKLISTSKKETPTMHYRKSEEQGIADSKNFIELVNKCIEKCEAGDFEKIVPSRTKQIELQQSFDEIKLFIKLGEKYPNAMVSLVSSPETGTWIGATPELLVSTDKNSCFKTVAVAGTQPHSPEVDIRSVAWTQKDIEEQALVCRYIISCFKKIRLREYEEHGPKTVQAGNVLHLKTEYEVDMVATNFPQLGSTMLKLLHPTSAVCGMPLQNSLDFLSEHEGYNREYYSGFLGPVNIDSESHLYVNLRCMQLLDGRTAKIYAGAGVTKESIAEKEWEETEIKMSTLLNVINE
jgi:isochorismate synthase